MYTQQHNSALLPKAADVVVQITAIGYPAINGSWWLGIVALCAVQVFSCILNACLLSKQYRNRFRRYYEVLLMIMVTAGLFCTMISANWMDDAGAIARAVMVIFGIIAGTTILGMMVMYLAFSIKELLYLDRLSFKRVKHER